MIKKRSQRIWVAALFLCVLVAYYFAERKSRTLQPNAPVPAVPASAEKSSLNPKGPY